MVNKVFKVLAMVDLLIFIIFSIMFVELTAINETSLFILVILIVGSTYGAIKLTIDSDIQQNLYNQSVQHWYSTSGLHSC